MLITLLKNQHNQKKAPQMSCICSCLELIWKRGFFFEINELVHGTMSGKCMIKFFG